MKTKMNKRFPIAPLTTIIGDPDWRCLSREQKRKIRMLHAKKLRLTRIPISKGKIRDNVPTVGTLPANWAD